MQPHPLTTLFDVAPLFIMFPIIFLIIREVLDYKTRRRLIEKGTSGEEANAILKSTMRKYTPSSLKWGLILTLVGIAMVILRVVDDFATEIYLGIMLIAGGLALLIYYGIARSAAKNNGS